jgi:ACS family sodium-dependent inorganic phosphate cotransporter-like MFS transporter 9
MSLGVTSSFSVAILFTTLAMFSKSFHSFGSSLSPLDIAPKHAGFVFGIINSAGSFSGRGGAGSEKANGREPKTCLSRVFNYKLGCFDDVFVFIFVDARPHL